MAQRGSDGPKRVPNDQKHWFDHLGPFWTLLDHLRTLTGLLYLAIFSPKWIISGPSPVMKDGARSKKKAYHQVCYVWPVCRNPKRPLWNINMAASYEICQGHRKWTQIISIIGSWGGHLGSISGVLGTFGGLWGTPKPNWGHFSGRFFPSLTPPCQPSRIFMVQNGSYRCPTHSTTYFMFNSHLLRPF